MNTYAALVRAQETYDRALRSFKMAGENYAASLKMEAFAELGEYGNVASPVQAVQRAIASSTACDAHKAMHDALYALVWADVDHANALNRHTEASVLAMR